MAICIGNLNVLRKGNFVETSFIKQFAEEGHWRCYKQEIPILNACMFSCSQFLNTKTHIFPKIIEYKQEMPTLKIATLHSSEPSPIVSKLTNLLSVLLLRFSISPAMALKILNNSTFCLVELRVRKSSRAAAGALGLWGPEPEDDDPVVVVISGRSMLSLELSIQWVFIANIFL